MRHLPLLAAALVFTSCAKHYIIPNTAEGNACSRQCMQVFNTCRAGRSDAVCAREESNCRSTCPGAYEEGSAQDPNTVAEQKKASQPPKHEEGGGVFGGADDLAGAIHR